MLPEEFLNYVFRKRIEALKMLLSEGMDSCRVLIEFTRTTPVVVTDGPAGLSGSVKMIGFIPREEYLEEMVLKAKRYAYIEKPKSLRETIEVLLREFYREERIDFRYLGALEMAFKHSWENIRATKRATLVFYTPPSTSYEVRCDVEIHFSGPIKEYLNALHDIFHRGDKPSDYPAYLFKIREIYDNSSSLQGFGKKIYEA